MGSGVPVLFGWRGASEATVEGGDCFEERRHRPTLTASSLDSTTSGPLRLSVVSMRRGGAMTVRSRFEDSLEVLAETWSVVDGQVLAHRCGVYQAGSLSFTDISEPGSRGRNAYWPVYGSHSCASNTLSACRRCRTDRQCHFRSFR